MIVALLNQQAGVGKATSALHLADVWSCQGQRVAAIDGDPQGSDLEWSDPRANEGLPRRFCVIRLARNTLHREAPEIARDANHVALDGPSCIVAPGLALRAADVVLVPTQPSPFDGLQFAETLRPVNKIAINRPEVPARLVSNRCDLRAVTARRGAQARTDDDPAVLTRRIGQRAVFAAAAQDGRLVFQMADSEGAASEITTLSEIETSAVTVYGDVNRLVSARSSCAESWGGQGCNPEMPARGTTSDPPLAAQPPSTSLPSMRRRRRDRNVLARHAVLEMLRELRARAFPKHTGGAI